VILFLTTADTEVLALRAAIESLPAGFPAVRAATVAAWPDAPPPLHGVDAVIVRLLGGRRAWEAPFDEMARACAAGGIPLLAFGGEAALDAELTACSTVPAATVSAAFDYLVRGGVTNMAHCLRFVADTVLMTGFGFDAAEPVPDHGVVGGEAVFATFVPDRPTVAVLFYRAHLLAGNTHFVEELCEALRARNVNAYACWCYSLRPDADGDVPVLSELVAGRADCIVTTVLAMGVTRTDDGTVADGWSVPVLDTLDIPVVHAVAATTSRAEWEASDVGLSPLDTAWSVALPEFDGRIISVPLSFKEVVDDGDDLGTPVIAYRTIPDRVARVAGIAARLARLRHVPAAEKRIVLVLSAYPTKRGRIGNAVGLDTPASVIALLHALRDSGCRVDRIPHDGDALMAELIETFAYEKESLTPAQLERSVGAVDTATYGAWFAALPQPLQDAVTERWGPPPGTVYVHDGQLRFAGLDLGGVLVAVQPPRGFGEDPIAIYHSPELPPTHHYLAFYRWLELGWRADAVVHVGKHGNLEWLPGKGVGLSAACAPDAALGDLPLVYPFVVNDPGEGTQAKRRAHAVVIDHLVPPMTRAETYDDLARLERLLDEYYQVQTLDPAKTAAIRARIWDLIEQAELHRDLERADRPDDDEFDAFVLHLDGYLCELKDAQIRGGLHVLGSAPDGDGEIDLLTALLRLPQGSVPSLRAALLNGDGSREAVDFADARAKDLLRASRANGWRPAVDGQEVNADTRRALQFACDTLVPRLRATTNEITNTLHALAGGYVPAGPSGAPTRGMAHVLPTGRNFYSVDPKTLPTAIAFEVGWSLAQQVVERHRAATGEWPRSIGLVVWGTAAMRTHGDDIAQALALLGVRPTWAEESGRVTGLEVIPRHELGRPRIDVTLRISGFFRDAFPHLVHLFDDACALVAALDELPEDNFVRAHGDEPRVFGAKPGAYGSGILPLLDSRAWRDDADLAAVYLAWSGYSYSRRSYGEAAPDAFRRRLALVDVAVKNQDNREHDIFDSDDYLQEHGGMVASIRAITGRQPHAFFGDSADPAAPRVRTLQDEARRVVRTRVVNPKWIGAMMKHGYKGAFELAATVDYLFGYDATARVGENWMYERVVEAYVGDPEVRKFFEQSNPWALTGIAERLLEAHDRGLWEATDASLATVRDALLEAEGWQEGRER
jgi:cobaltochelatase CobN